MNLQNLGVQEMNAKEIREIDGGIWPWVAIIGVSLMLESAINGFVAGFKAELEGIGECE